MSNVCRFCGYGGEFKSRFENWDRFSNETFIIQECRQCNCGRTEAGPALELERYYPKAYYGTANRRFSHSVERLVGLFRESRARFIKRFARDAASKILDIGCGRGLMLNHLQREGWTCFGIEFSEESSLPAKQLIGERIRVVPRVSGLDFDTESLDVVSLWHVLEHLSEPDLVVRESKRILRRDGLLVIEVPNFASLQAKLSGKSWIYLEAPRHLYHISPKGLCSLLASNGFSVVHISSRSLEFGLFGMFQSVLNPFFRRPNFAYSMLSLQERKHLLKHPASHMRDLFILLVLTVPALLVAALLEFVSVLCGRGGVIRVVAKQEARHS